MLLLSINEVYVQRWMEIIMTVWEWKSKIDIMSLQKLDSTLNCVRPPAAPLFFQTDFLKVESFASRIQTKWLDSKFGWEFLLFWTFKFSILDCLTSPRLKKKTLETWTWQTGNPCHVLDLCSQTLSVFVIVNHQKQPQESKSVQELKRSNIASVAMSLWATGVWMVSCFAPHRTHCDHH